MTARLTFRERAELIREAFRTKGTDLGGPAQRITLEHLTEACAEAREEERQKMQVSDPERLERIRQEVAQGHIRPSHTSAEWLLSEIDRLTGGATK
jgi:hypothetical protein